MTRSMLFATVTSLVLGACAGDSSSGWGDPSVSCEPLCSENQPCDDQCVAPDRGLYDLRVAHAVALDGASELPRYEVFTSEAADVLLAPEDGPRTTAVELGPNGYVIVVIGEDSCVFPAWRGLLTCTTDRYELALELL